MVPRPSQVVPLNPIYIKKNNKFFFSYVELVWRRPPTWHQLSTTLEIKDNTSELPLPTCGRTLDRSRCSYVNKFKKKNRKKKKKEERKDSSEYQLRNLFFFSKLFIQLLTIGLAPSRTKIVVRQSRAWGTFQIVYDFKEIIDEIRKLRDVCD